MSGFTGLARQGVLQLGELTPSEGSRHPGLLP